MEEKIGNIETNVEWIIKKLDHLDSKYARKWTEKLVWLMATGILLWTLNELLSLIPTVNAIFN